MKSAQLLVSLLTLLLVYLVARQLSRSSEIAVLAFMLVVVTSRFTELFQLLRPYVLVAGLTMLAAYLVLLSSKLCPALLGGVAGLALGAAALTEPALILAAVLIVPAPLFCSRDSRGRSVRAVTGLAIGVSLALVPWFVPGDAVLDRFASPGDVASTMLAKRLTYNGMTGIEWLASWIIWLPGIGDGLASLFFSPDTLARIGQGHAAGIVASGEARILAEGASAGRAGGRFQGLVARHITGDFWNYLTSLLPIFQRGFWGSGTIMSLAGIFFLARLFRRLRATGSAGAFGLVFWVIAAGVLARALLSPNYNYINDAMLFVYAYAIAHVTGGLELPRLLRK